MIDLRDVAAVFERRFGGDPALGDLLRPEREVAELDLRLAGADPIGDQRVDHLGLVVGAALALLLVALLVGSFGVEAARRAGVGSWLAFLVAIPVSTGLVLAFTWGAYRLITNVPLSWRSTLPGALVATALLQASFQVVPLFVRATAQLVSLQAFGGLLLMLVWLYLMANVLVLGAEVNVVYAQRSATEAASARAARARWLTRDRRQRSAALLVQPGRRPERARDQERRDEGCPRRVDPQPQRHRQVGPTADAVGQNDHWTRSVSSTSELLCSSTSNCPGASAMIVTRDGWPAWTGAVMS